MYNVCTYKKYYDKERLCTGKLYSPELLRKKVESKTKTPIEENKDDYNGRIPSKIEENKDDYNGWIPSKIEQNKDDYNGRIPSKIE